ncbi:hypothetical protein B0H13DRAFT_2656527 [Mycena leptocephala]|nr:hypothetical protein B0H13DRAFT_2656527 [Mycena leptocephala]
MSCMNCNSNNCVVRDFQGHVLTLARSVNPVTTSTQNIPTTQNQAWHLYQDHTGTWPVISHVTGPRVLAGTESPLNMQAIASLQPGALQSDINLHCINTTAVLFTINTPAGPVALTAWEGPNSPVTFSLLTTRSQQIWALESLD